jgi:hypothetical protein
LGIDDYEEVRLDPVPQETAQGGVDRDDEAALSDLAHAGQDRVEAGAGGEDQ